MNARISLLLTSVLLVGEPAAAQVATERNAEPGARALAQDAEVKAVRSGDVHGETVNAQIGATIETKLQSIAELEGASTESIAEAARVLNEYFQSMIISVADESYAVLVAADASASSSERDFLSTVTTKRGILAVIDKGDGVVHVFVFAHDSEPTDLQNADALAAQLTITQIEPGFVLIDEDALTRFVGAGKQNAERNVDAGFSDDATGLRRNEEVLETQLTDLGDIDALPVEELKETAPEVYNLFQPMIASMEKGIFSPREADKLFDTTTEVKEQFLKVVPTKSGVISIVDRGDGVVDLFFTSLDRDHTDSQNTSALALALHIELTSNGVDVMSVDEEALAQFVGAGDKRAELGVVAAKDGDGADDLTDGALLSVDIECPPALCSSKNCCCIVATDEFVCFACFSVANLSISLACDRIK